MRFGQYILLPNIFFPVSGWVAGTRRYSNNKLCWSQNVWLFCLYTGVLPGICRGDDAAWECWSPKRHFSHYIMHGAVDEKDYTWSCVREIHDAGHMSMVVPMYMSVHCTSTRASTVHGSDGSNPPQVGDLYCPLCIAPQQLREVLCIDGTGTSCCSTFYVQICLGNGKMDVKEKRAELSISQHGNNPCIIIGVSICSWR